MGLGVGLLPLCLHCATISLFKTLFFHLFVSLGQRLVTFSVKSQQVFYAL